MPGVFVPSDTSFASGSGSATPDIMIHKTLGYIIIQRLLRRLNFVYFSTLFSNGIIIVFLPHERISYENCKSQSLWAGRKRIILTQ